MSVADKFAINGEFLNVSQKIFLFSFWVKLTFVFTWLAFLFCCISHNIHLIKAPRFLQSLCGELNADRKFQVLLHEHFHLYLPSYSRIRNNSYSTDPIILGVTPTPQISIIFTSYFGIRSNSYPTDPLLYLPPIPALGATPTPQIPCYIYLLFQH